MCTLYMSQGYMCRCSADYICVIGYVIYSQASLHNACIGSFASVQGPRRTNILLQKFVREGGDARRWMDGFYCRSDLQRQPERERIVEQRREEGPRPCELVLATWRACSLHSCTQASGQGLASADDLLQPARVRSTRGRGGDLTAVRQDALV